MKNLTRIALIVLALGLGQSSRSYAINITENSSLLEGVSGNVSESVHGMLEMVPVEEIADAFSQFTLDVSRKDMIRNSAYLAVLAKLACGVGVPASLSNLKEQGALNKLAHALGAVNGGHAVLTIPEMIARARVAKELAYQNEHLSDEEREDLRLFKEKGFMLLFLTLAASIFKSKNKGRFAGTIAHIVESVTAIIHRRAVDKKYRELRTKAVERYAADGMYDYVEPEVQYDEDGNVIENVTEGDSEEDAQDTSENIIEANSPVTSEAHEENTEEKPQGSPISGPIQTAEAWAAEVAAQIKIAEEEFEALITQAEHAVAAQIEALKASADEEIAELYGQLSEQTEQFENAAQERVDVVASQMDAEIARIEDEKALAIAEVTKQAEDEIAEISTEVTTQIDQATDEIEQRVAAVRSRLAQEEAVLYAELEAELTHIRGNLSARIEEIMQAATSTGESDAEAEAAAEVNADVETEVVISA